MLVPSLIVATLCLAAAAADAAQITFAPQAPISAHTVTLHARRVDGTGALPEKPVAIESVADLPLPDGIWEVRATGDGIWGAPAFGRNGDAMTLRLWPAAALKGTINDIEALRVQFTSAQPDGPSGETDCTIAGKSWTCWIPTGRSDLRFSSGGFAPEFRFDVAVPAKEEMRLNFVAGASLSGRVEPVRGLKGGIDEVEVKLISATGTENLIARTNVKGFFQFKGVAPGDYSIRGQKKELVTQSESVRVLARLAAELRMPLLLDTPKQLTVSVVPRVDPAGKPWIIKLASSNDRLRRSEVIAESPISAAGDWVHPRLTAGDYEVTLLTGSGSEWKSEAVTIAASDVTLSIAALARRVRGTVTLGDRPLAASLSFGGEWGVKMRSDAEGKFSGDIPSGDEMPRLVLVEANTPRVRRSVKPVFEERDNELRVAIALPSTTVMGTVTNPDRSPEPHAILTVNAVDGEALEQTFSERDGSFQIGGFEPGRYTIMAEAAGKRSPTTPIELRADQPSEVQLVVEKVVEVRGRVTSGEIPAIGAEVFAMPRDRSWAPLMPHTRTNDSGYFELQLTPGTTIFDAIVVHPAFDTVVGRSIIQAEKQMHIRTEQIGGTMTVEGSSLRGAIVAHNGAEIDAGALAHLAGGTATDERISIPRLQPGHYTVCAAGQKQCVSGDLAPLGTLTLSLRSD